MSTIENFAIQIKKSVDKLGFVFLIIAIVSLFTMMVLISLNTVLRYFFNSPITGAYAVVELYFMMIVFYFSIEYVEKEEANVRVDLVSRKFPDYVNKWVEILYLSVTFIFISWICFLVFARAMSFWENGTTTSGVIQFPIYISWAIVVIGFLLLLLRILNKLAGLLYDQYYDTFSNLTQTGGDHTKND